jgi:hypothetical protein
MKMKHKIILFCIVVLSIILLSSSLGLISCSCNDIRHYDSINDIGGEEYTTFFAQQGIPKFSFEYSNYYELLSYQSMPEFPGTYVALSGSETEEEKGNIKRVAIHINDYSKNAKSELNRRISDCKSVVRAGMGKDFKLHAINRVKINEIEAWESTVTFTTIPKQLFDDLTISEKQIPVVSFDLCFMYQELGWNLTLFSDSSTYEQARTDYEHIIKTLKFLK